MIGSRRSSRAWPLTLLGFFLAAVAMLTLTSVAGWHSANMHDDTHAVAWGVERVGESQQDSADSPLHSVAHATGELVAVDSKAAIPAAPRSDRGSWLSLVTRIRGGNDPSMPLRPPRT